MYEVSDSVVVTVIDKLILKHFFKVPNDAHYYKNHRMLK
jgi:hypothetical protein